MRLYRQRSRTSKKPGGIAAPLFVCGLLLGAACWLGWREGWFSRFKKTRPRTVASTTNGIAARSSIVVTNSAATNRPFFAVRTNAPAAAVDKAVLPPAVLTNVQGALPGPKSAAVLDAQVALDRIAFSPGSIDGVMGAQTRSALRAFQANEGLPASGELDPQTRLALSLVVPALTTYQVTGSEFAQFHPVPGTWLGKSEQASLDFESLLEMLAERSHSHPNLLRRLNPGVDWTAVHTGAEITLPSVNRDPPRTKAAYLCIRLAARTLDAFDGSGRVLAHFPCSIAQRVEKRPVGELHVAVTAPGPNYTFNPDIFPESAEGRQLGRRLIIPSGPNNPVGTVWIGLDRPGYGIHGTPRPEDVGRTESHGCFRLANWNAEYLLKLIAAGTPVRIEL